MDLFALVAAFGGGVLGAMLGALPVFILTGVFAVVGGLMGMAGIAELSIGSITFGSMLGPHIAFAGGVAAAAFAGKKKLIPNGADILYSLHGTGSSAVICVGGMFGVMGYLIKFFYGDVLHLRTDLPAITVITLAIITRLVFGTTGLFGKYEGTEKRAWVPTGSPLVYNILLGLGIGAAVSGVAVSLLSSGASKEAMAMFPNRLLRPECGQPDFCSDGLCRPGFPPHYPSGSFGGCDDGKCMDRRSGGDFLHGSGRHAGQNL